MPITTTSNDVIFVGHGTYQGGAQNFTVPAGVELWMLQPVGSAITDGPVTALVGNTAIDRLILCQTNGECDDFHTLGLPQRIAAGQQAPNLILHDLADLKALVQAAIPRGPNHVIMVTQDTNLQTLLGLPDVQKMIQAHVASHTVLRVFWAACTHLQQNPNDPPAVYGNALAVALAAAKFAKTHNTPAVVAAAGAALDFARLHPQDGPGAVAAAAAHDATTANLIHIL